MNWHKLDNLAQIEEIKLISQDKPVMIFKHSTRCSISSMALNRLMRNWKETDQEKIVPFYLDLISYRDISNQIAAEFGVYHESPQVIIIKNGKALYHNSHMGINYPDIINHVNN